MNRRQRKKKQKKIDLFIESWVSSYRELKEVDRSYHEYVVTMRRKKNSDLIDEF